MDFGWPLTLAALAAALLLFAFAWWRSRQPVDPLRVRLIDYHYVQLTALVAVLVLLAHLVTLIAGRPLTGQR